MARKRRLFYLNNQISRSLALAHLAHNKIDQFTVPAAVARDPPLEEDDVFQDKDNFYLDCPTGLAEIPAKSESDSSFPYFACCFCSKPAGQNMAILHTLTLWACGLG